ncbi:GyrI-like domain-containing protein [Streptomyces sp. st77]|uniref:GyrI-like domain-containing protein n=1 Tax=Streptomyces sp. st77 TaxID=1828074 RepID=UPI00211D6374|nr:GyrI-like domain-containing protein [Streptomyces sp. st77]
MNAEPTGLLQVSDGLDPDAAAGSERTYLHGIVLSTYTSAPDNLDVIEVPTGQWAAFRTSGPHPQTLQTTSAATATEWFPSNP